jgi:ubiquinone/menaquinone biosynthesis C-methylase UbiE
MKIGVTIDKEFDAFSVNYTEDMTKCVPHYQKLLSSFSKNLPKGFNPKRILDLGCGNGNVTAQLLQSFPNAQYELLDASNQMINLCRNRFKEYSINYHTTFFYDFHFSENSYDMVVAGFSLHHCSAIEKKALFKKIYTSLKPGGVFGYSDLMIDKTKAEHKVLLKKWKSFVLKNYANSEKWEWLMDHYAQFDMPDSLEKQMEWLQQAGFKEIEPIIYDAYWVHIRATK